MFFGILIVVSGCAQSTASLLGPAYTLANTGSLYQASFSYGVNRTLKELTGKSSKEHGKEILIKSEKYEKKIETYKEKKEQEIKDIIIRHEEFLTAIKAHFEESKEKLVN